MKCPTTPVPAFRRANAANEDLPTRLTEEFAVIRRPIVSRLIHGLTVSLAFTGAAFAFDAAATASRLKELGLKMDGYKEATPESVQTATSIGLGAAKGVSEADLDLIIALPRLNLVSANTDSALTPAGFRILAKGGKLTRLNLNQAQLSDESLAVIATMPNLTEVSLVSARGITAAGVARLAELKKLQILRLDKLSLSDEAFRDFAGHPALMQVDINHVAGLSDKTLEYLGTMPKFGYFYAEKTGLTSAGLAHLKNPAQFGSISLNGCAVKPDELAILSRFTNLWGLALNDTEADDSVVGALSSLPKLRQVQMRATKITDAGVKEFAKFRELLALDLGGATLTDAALKGVVFSKLTSLSLHRTGVTNAVLADIVRQPALTFANLWKTEVTKEAIDKAVSERAATLPKLSVQN